jgi:DNA excision repair protein ERCC-5
VSRNPENHEDHVFFNSHAFVKLQAQALNQQGNLNEYFRVNSTGGVVAPRKRKTYASKRLQQVVNDFREQRKRATEMDNNDAGAGGEDSSTTSSESDVNMPPRPATKRGKARGESSVGDAGKRRGRGGRGRGSTRGARAGPSRKRKRSVTASSDNVSAGGQDLSSQSESPPPPPSGTASRPRARPAFRGTGSQKSVR